MLYDLLPSGYHQREADSECIRKYIAECLDFQFDSTSDGIGNEIRGTLFYQSLRFLGWARLKHETAKIEL